MSPIAVVMCVQAVVVSSKTSLCKPDLLIKKTFKPVAVLLSSKNQSGDMCGKIELLGPLHTEVEHRTQSTGLPGIY